jgi:thymidylate kinase
LIVEFIGSTGAGKSTIIREVQSRLVSNTQVTTSFDLVAAPLGLSGVRHPSIRNFIQELIGLPYFIKSLRQHKAFIAYNLRMWARQKIFSLFAFNNLRSLERKIGVYEIISRKEQRQIILVDEGTVLQAHHVFVFTDACYSEEEISKFAVLLPLPDLIVYVRAPKEILIQRSLHRSDPPRLMRSKNRELNEKYIRRAVAMFEHLIETEVIQQRVLIVDNPDLDEVELYKVVNNITEFILQYEPSSTYPNA